MPKKSIAQELKPHREKIDQIDNKLVKLLSERGREVQAVGKVKASQNGSFYVPEREAVLLKRLKKINPGPYSEKALESIFREIVSASLALEAPLYVSFLGPAATFTHLAALKKLGASAEFLPQTTLREVFEEVANGRVDYGIVPIENSIEGVVTHTLDLFSEFSLKICGEVEMEITHHLLSLAKSLKKIKTVYSHPHALAQCRTWLEKHLSHASLREVTSTARAAQLASKEEHSAAVASQYAAGIYGLGVLRRRIEDHPNNFTRFLMIGRSSPKATGQDKTSLMLSVKDQPGVLVKLLTPLSEAKINLTKIESRPLKKQAWEYLFFIDLVGHVEEPSVAKAIQKMEKLCKDLKHLGSYPKEASRFR